MIVEVPSTATVFNLVGVAPAPENGFWDTRSDRQTYIHAHRNTLLQEITFNLVRVTPAPENGQHHHRRSLLTLPAEYAQQGLCNGRASVRPSVCPIDRH